VSIDEAARSRNDAADALEAVIGRLLVAGTWLAMALVLVGVLLMLAGGIEPLTRSGLPSFDPSRIPGDMVALQPGGFLWAGISLIVILPVGRVVVAGLGFLAARDGRLALVSLLVLLVVVISIAAALGLEG
jgi:uncharacterized membrane protein